MGYPMTYRRVLNRNGLAEGGYTEAGLRPLGVNLWTPGLLENSDGERCGPDSPEFLVVMAPHWRQRLVRYDSAQRSVLGDLRRLEQDATDEDAVCKRIALVTGIDADDVAAVLQAFIA